MSEQQDLLARLVQLESEPQEVQGFLELLDLLGQLDPKVLADHLDQLDLQGRLEQQDRKEK